MKDPFRQSLRDNARVLRKNQTEAEKLFWQAVRKRKINGYLFLRQKCISHYIVDFYCAELKLAIEIDGKIHDRLKEADRIRTSDLQALNITVIRFTNDQVKTDLPSVISHLKTSIDSIASSPPFCKKEGPGVDYGRVGTRSKHRGLK